MPNEPAAAGQEPTPQPGQEPTPPAGQEPAPTPGQEPGTPPAGGGQPEPETFDRAYVENLRREAAGYRTRSTQAETALEQARTQHQQEVERVSGERDALQTRVNELLVSQSVQGEAGRMGFHDPEDAVRLADTSTLTVGQDGRTVTGVKEALQALATSKPHLLKGRGKGDAPGGASSGLNKDMNAAIRTAAGRAAPTN